MTYYIEYCRDGTVVTEFNYESERKLFLGVYLGHKNLPPSESSKWFYCTELGIDMIRLLVVEKLVDPNDLRFVFKEKLLTIDSDAIFDTEGKDKSILTEFCSCSVNMARNIMAARSRNRKGLS